MCCCSAHSKTLNMKLKSPTVKTNSEYTSELTMAKEDAKENLE